MKPNERNVGLAVLLFITSAVSFAAMIIPTRAHRELLMFAVNFWFGVVFLLLGFRYLYPSLPSRKWYDWLQMFSSSVMFTMVILQLWRIK